MYEEAKTAGECCGLANSYVATALNKIFKKEKDKLHSNKTSFFTLQSGHKLN